jgi:hypothetical protein
VAGDEELVSDRIIVIGADYDKDKKMHRYHDQSRCKVDYIEGRF